MKKFNAVVVRQVATLEDRCDPDCFFLKRNYPTQNSIPLCELYGENLEQTSSYPYAFRCPQCLKEYKDEGKWADRFNPNNYKDGKYIPPVYN